MMKRELYPPWWEMFSYWIRFHRAKGQCECRGECGLHRDHPGPRRCVERNGEPAKWARGKVVLTVAHLDHDPGNWDVKKLKERVRAMCNRCHLRYDTKHHQANAKATRKAKQKQVEIPF